VAKVRSIDEREALLRGITDLHVHTMPDVRQRKLSDIELAKEAARVGARAVVIKSHLVPTMDRAFITEKVVPGIRVFGGITLNSPVGGLNAAAVDIAIKMGAKFVWLPTSYSAHEKRAMGTSGGVECVIDGKPVPDLVEVLKLVAQNDIVLSTGHYSAREIRIVVEEAKKQGVKKILVSHPEWTTMDISIEDQKGLADCGVMFERCYARKANGVYDKNFARNLDAIEKLGYQSTIISTDGGQMENPVWTEALSEYIAYLLDAGLCQTIVDKMTKEYPARLLGLDDSGRLL